MTFTCIRKQVEKELIEILEQWFPYWERERRMFAVLSKYRIPAGQYDINFRWKTTGFSISLIEGVAPTTPPGKWVVDITRKDQ